ncbi:DNA mismatch endonuclease Vsr [Cellulomonas gelida]|uniref:DNA mismatch endonuclease Vsr n=1 Tax=Cellulomonas gelida TaxID=1712 RepID=UPI0011411F09|nr:DNA mismatch endonuclease Vsr [Cellulomonas gelida]
MSAARRRDTKPEMLLRRELHRRGRRFRVVLRVSSSRRRTIDIAFTRSRLAVFVDGCFWHGCPHHGTLPATNGEWWAAKLKANRDRDADTNRLLKEAAWTVLRIWEHVPADQAADLVERVLAEIAGEQVARRGPAASARAASTDRAR